MKFFKWLTFLLMGIFVVGCANVKQMQSPKASKAIGVVFPMSSQVSHEILDGMNLALTEVNNTLPEQEHFQLVRGNSENSGGVLKEVENLFSQKVRVFCLGFDSDVILSHKVLSSMSSGFFNFMMTYPPATLNGKTSTRIFLNGAQEADLMASVVKGDKTIKRIAILSEDSFIGKSVGDYLNFCVATAERKIYRDYFNSGEKSFDIYAMQITAEKPSVIFYIGSGKEFTALQKALNNAGFKGKVVKNRGYLLHDNTIATHKILYKSENFESKLGKDFHKKFVAKYNRNPSLFSAYGYDNVKLLVSAMQKANFRVSGIRNSFVNKNYEGASGKLSFDSSADCTAELDLK